MSPDILWLHELRFIDIAAAGGKGANLGELIWKGFPIPPGFVVTVEAYKQFFHAAHLHNEIQDLYDLTLDELKERYSVIRDTIQKTEMPQQLANTILAAYHQLAKKQNQHSTLTCAIRSSATAEDLRRASFAGQHDTYYYVNESHLLQMIKYCWASLWRPEAVIYRIARKVSHKSVFMAVIVQEMIPADISGITFTANPVTGSQEELIIESGWGMGAAIVDGRVTPDRYLVDRKTLKLREKRIAEKRFMVPATLKEPGKGRLEEVSYEMRQQETLSPDHIKTVAEWAIKAEEHFGIPQDIEWSMTNGHLYILQSRPVTTIESEEIGRDIHGQYVLHKPIIENFTEPFTPLTVDLLVRFLPPGHTFIQGWLYFDLRFIRPIIPFKMSDEDLINLLYFNLDTLLPTARVSLRKLPLSLLFFVYLYFLYGMTLARTRNLPDDIMERFRPLCRKVERNPALGPIETIQRLLVLPKLLDPIGKMPLFVNLSAVRYLLLTGIVKKMLHRWVPNLRQETVALLCSGFQGAISTKIGYDILALAKEAKRDKRVRELLLACKPEEMLLSLKNEPKATEFINHLNTFLAQNGHRAFKELDFQSSRWEENPAPVLGMIRNYLLVESDPDENEKTVTQARHELMAEIRRELEKYPLERRFRLRWHLLRYVADHIKYFSKLRENSRFYHSMGFYATRKKILRIEADLIRQGKLKCKDDIFFLHWDEIVKLQNGQFDWKDVEEQIHQRHLEHVRLSAIIPPKTIGFPPKETQPATALSPGDSAILQGQPASPGIYEGIAHVILDPSLNTELKPGEILVAPYTAPAWTPIFLTAGAAVVEVGSYLSHAGTLAREYGMPCVVDVDQCTKRIQTGDRLSVDGNNGIVKIFSNAE